MEDSNTLSKSQTRSVRTIKIVLIVAAILIIAGFVGAVYFLLQETTPTARIRDIFIIFLGFELLVIGIAAVLLIIQTARLVNMFQHEVKPVLDAANETLSTVRGTAIFLSDSLAQPVIKMSGYFASVRKVLKLLKINTSTIEKYLPK